MPDISFLWPPERGIAIEGLEMAYDDVSKPKFELTYEYLMSYEGVCLIFFFVFFINSFFLNDFFFCFFFFLQ